MNKKILSLVLALMMVFALLQTSVLAESTSMTDAALEEAFNATQPESEFTDYELLEQQTQNEIALEATVTPLDFTNVGDEEGQTPATGLGYAWFEATKTLYLYGLNLAVEGTSEKINSSAILLPAGATIVANGLNYVTAAASTGTNASAIYCKGDLTIGGLGLLSVRGNAVSGISAGLAAKGTITILGAVSVKAVGGDSEEGMLSTGIYAKDLIASGIGTTVTAIGGKSAIISAGLYLYDEDEDGASEIKDGAIVYLSAASSAISAGVYANRDLRVSDATLTVNVPGSPEATMTMGVYIDGDEDNPSYLALADAVVNVTVGDASSVIGLQLWNLNVLNSYLTVKTGNAATTMNGIRTENDISANDGSHITVTTGAVRGEHAQDNVAVYSGHDVSLYNSTVTLNPGPAAIYAVENANEANMVGTYCYGLFAEHDIAIGGDAVVTAAIGKAGGVHNNAIYATNDFLMENGYVGASSVAEAAADNHAIQAGNNLKILGGTARTTAKSAKISEEEFIGFDITALDSTMLQAGSLVIGSKYYQAAFENAYLLTSTGDVQPIEGCTYLDISAEDEYRPSLVTFSDSEEDQTLVVYFGGCFTRIPVLPIFTGTYKLYIDGKFVSDTLFTKTLSGNWTIQFQKDDGTYSRYLIVADGKLAYTSFPAEWTYSNGRFYMKASSGSTGFFPFWGMPTTTTYYLACEGNYLVASTSPAGASSTLYQNKVRIEHKLVKTQDYKAPTCCTKGNVKTFYCTVCEKYFDENGAQIVDNTIPVVSHEPGMHIEGFAANCFLGTPGIREHWLCKYCGIPIDENGTVVNTIVPAEHTFGEWVDEIPATCLFFGIKGYKQCIGCGRCFDENDKVLYNLIELPLGHDFKSSEWSWNAHYHYRKCAHEGCPAIWYLAAHTWLLDEAASDDTKTVFTCTCGAVSELPKGGCVTKLSALLTTDGDYEMVFGEDISAGTYTFTWDESGWLIQNGAGKYIALEEGVCTESDDPFRWYVFGNTLFTSVTSSPFFTTNYYLTSDTENTLSVTTNAMKAAVKFYVPASGEHSLIYCDTIPATCISAGTKAHTYCTLCGKCFIGTEEVAAEDLTIAKTEHVFNGLAVPCANGEEHHHVCCAFCGKESSEETACTYNEHTHRCVCGRIDPTVEAFTVKVDTSKATYGWFWFKSTVYKANIKVTPKSMTTLITGIQYSFDQEHWANGTSVNSFTKFDTLWVRVSYGNHLYRDYQFTF